MACRVVAHANSVSSQRMSAFAKATARQSSLFSTTRAKTGGKGIRTPDFQLAKLALYQLSYAPAGNFECRLPIFDCKGIKARMPDVAQASRHPARVVSVVCFIA